MWGQYLGSESSILAVPNSDSNTVSLVNMSSGTEVGIYALAQSEYPVTSPSRTAFDNNGDLWVAHRGLDTIVKIGTSGTLRQDIVEGQTSSGTNVLTWGTDTKVLKVIKLARNNYGTYLPGVSYSPVTYGGGSQTNTEGLRGMACDKNGFLWVMGYGKNPNYIWKIDINTDTVVAQYATSCTNTGYGAVYNKISDRLFFTINNWNGDSHFLMVDPNTAAQSIIGGSGVNGYYGLGIDTAGNMYRPNYAYNRVYKFNSMGQYITYTTLSGNGYSCCVYQGYLYVANAGGSQLWTLNPSTMALLDTYSMPSLVHGVGGDPQNPNVLWCMNYVAGSNKVYKVTLNNTTKLPASVETKYIGTTLHYNYSDFTGYYNTYDTT